MRLKGKLALVTGASRGLGRATALALVREGAHVIITARSQGALEELDDEIRKHSGTATILRLDLRNGDQIDHLGPTIFQRWGRLDILIGNGGMLGPLSPLPHVTGDQWQQVIDVNLSANWRLIRTLDPLLKNAEAGRVVFVSSGAVSSCRAYWGPYSVTKAGLEALARTYAAECANSPVRVNVVNPGPMRTIMRAKAFPGENPETLPEPAAVAPLLVELALPATTANGEVIAFHDWRTLRGKAETAGSDAATLDEQSPAPPAKGKGKVTVTE
jgi:NAD(P)-dependent dehydrogenase (short-subunit alcohol dehydrogenase family)